jgi:hypothetical protein
MKEERGPYILRLPGESPEDDGPLDFSVYEPIEASFPPPMEDDAFYGLSGEVVRAIAAQSEACQEAILIHWLAAIGNIIGRSAQMFVGDTLHHPRIWSSAVGGKRVARVRPGMAQREQ